MHCIGSQESEFIGIPRSLTVDLLGIDPSSMPSLCLLALPHFRYIGWGWMLIPKQKRTTWWISSIFRAESEINVTAKVFCLVPVLAGTLEVIRYSALGKGPMTPKNFSIIELAKQSRTRQKPSLLFHSITHIPVSYVPIYPIFDLRRFS